MLPIGVYPIPGGEVEFQKEIAAYKAGKGTLRFPLDQPIPFRLIASIVRLRRKENLDLAKAKR